MPALYHEDRCLPDAHRDAADASEVITSTHVKREADRSTWMPTPCEKERDLSGRARPL